MLLKSLVLTLLIGVSLGYRGYRLLLPPDECPALVLPHNSQKFSCTNGWKVGTICWLLCDESRGYDSVRGQYTKCSSGKTWTQTHMECVDTESPQISNCPTQTIVGTKDPSSFRTLIQWPKITVRDNSGEQINLQSASSLVSASEGLFPEGYTLVKLMARDSSGNSAAACTFLVRIRGLLPFTNEYLSVRSLEKETSTRNRRSQAIECEAPKFDDQNLSTTNCNGFREDSVCQLRCSSGLTLRGNQYIECRRRPGSLKGIWDYGQVINPHAEKPHCEAQGSGSSTQPPMKQ